MTITTLFVDIFDEGDFGARLEIETARPPAQCPGLGGWKRSPKEGRWFTRVKGDTANQLLHILGPSGYGDIELVGDRITACWPYN